MLKKELATFLPTLDPPSACPVWEHGINQPPRPGPFNCPKALGTGRLSKAHASSPVLCDAAGLAAHLDGCRGRAPVGIIFRKCTLREVMPLLETLVLQGQI